MLTNNAVYPNIPSPPIHIQLSPNAKMNWEGFCVATYWQDTSAEV